MFLTSKESESLVTGHRESMFYVRTHGLITEVNCNVVPNSDVSGVGVRGALYMQAFVSIIMSLLPPDLGDVISTNVLIQVTSLSLVASAYFDSGIDVPHTLVASQFALLFSVVRITSYDLPLSRIRSEKELVVLSRMWLLDIFFRSCLAAFNYTVWSAIMDLQQLDSVCPDGMGTWYFFAASL